MIELLVFWWSLLYSVLHWTLNFCTYREISFEYFVTPILLTAIFLTVGLLGTVSWIRTKYLLKLKHIKRCKKYTCKHSLIIFSGFSFCICFYFLIFTLKNPSCRSVGSKGFPSGTASLDAFSMGMMYSNQKTYFESKEILCYC